MFKWLRQIQEYILYLNVVEYTTTVASAHELMRVAALLTDEAREIGETEERW